MKGDPLEVLDSSPRFQVADEEYVRLLGYPRGHDLTDRPKELMEGARAWYRENGRPWIYLRKVERLEWENGRLEVESVEFSSRRVQRTLSHAKASGAFVVAVSAGRECEETARRLWEEEKPDEYFFLEVFGSAVVESLVAAASFRMCEWADQRGLVVLPHDSPGYPGWNIGEQERLFGLIRARPRGGALPVEVLESGMLKPKKSLLALFGVAVPSDATTSAAQSIPCERCTLAECQYRRVQYRGKFPQLEDASNIRQSQPSSK